MELSFWIVQICFHNEDPCIIIKQVNYHLLNILMAYQENKALCIIRLEYAVLIKNTQIVDMTITKAYILSTASLLVENHSSASH